MENRPQGMFTHSDCEAPQGLMKENCVTLPLLRILIIPHPPADSKRNDTPSHELYQELLVWKESPAVFQSSNI